MRSQSSIWNAAQKRDTVVEEIEIAKLEEEEQRQQKITPPRMGEGVMGLDLVPVSTLIV